LISLWAGHKDDDPGYLDSKTPDQYFKEKHSDWGSPERIIYTFECPTIKGLTSSQYVRFLEPIIGDFITLKYSIVRLYDYYTEYRGFVISQFSLRHAVNEKDKAQNTASFTQEEVRFLDRVFHYNYSIHVKLIGGKDSKDQRCLYLSFRRARRSLQTFEDRLKPQAPPWWHWALHFMAAAFVVGGIYLLIGWICAVRF
jgi:hypothetical protein